ncbi:uncharacterized protein LOC144163738 [Haemaphysalis longicornis]
MNDIGPSGKLNAMERCLKKRAALRSQVTRILNEGQDAMQRDLLRSEAAVLHARLKKVTKNLETLDNKIETLVPDEDFEDKCAQVLDYNDGILSCLTRLQQRIDGDSVPSASPSTVINEVVVDKNEDLSSIDKYNFLRVSVTGDAATAIAGLSPTARCYNDAVQLLKKRFGNEELLIQEHFKKLIDLKPVRSSEDVRGLRRLHDTLAAHIRGLEALGRKLETFSSMLLPIAQRALPGDLLLDYSRKRVLDTSNDGHYSRQTPHTEGVPETTTDSQKGTVTSFCRLLDFLRVEVESRENLAALRRMDVRQEVKHEQKDRQKQPEQRPHKHAFSISTLTQSARQECCFFCDDHAHSTQNCSSGKSIEEKKRMLLSAGRCFRCTTGKHQARACRVNVKCMKCNKKHATTMCDPTYTARKSLESTEPVNNSHVSLGTVTHDGVPAAKTTVVLLPTAKVMCSGETYNAEIRTLFDGGSQRSFITSATSKRLGCQVVGNERLTVGVFGGRQEEKMFQRVMVTLNTKQGRRLKLEVLETDVICDHKIPAPPQSVAHQLGHLDCDIADLANGDAPEDIGLLIGSEYIWGLTTGRTRKLGESRRAVETVFGWSVQGPIEGTSQQNQCTETVTLRTSVVKDKTADVLSKFWTLESIGITDKEECKPGECAAMEVFEQTLTKVDGRYEVALPWKTEISLDDNKEIATKRLQQLTNRLLKSPELLPR